NPVRAGMVDHPSRYQWSSYGTNAEGRQSDFLVPHPLYLALDADPDERRRRYRSLFEIPEPPSELQRIREAVNSGTALARESFLTGVDEPTRIRASKRTRGRPGQNAKAEPSCSA
ncbi:MAG TPA: hypothetical protein VLS49_11020, partial [Usitatibacter sp.]|nr:hypothetical protein [Usitatibacter sp.]